MLYPVSDLAEFIQVEQTNRDIDPAYPVLRELTKTMEPEQKLWAIFCYLAFYDIASGWQVFSLHPAPTAKIGDELLRLPTGVERRNLRGGKPMAYHLASLLQQRHEYGGFHPWLTFHLKVEGDEAMRKGNWERVYWMVQGVWGNGRWSGYKQQPISEPVLTPSGWKPIGHLRIGDRVIGSDGKPTCVVGVYPQLDEKVYRVSFTDGSWTRCGPEHLWEVHHLSHRQREVLTTEQLMKGKKQRQGSFWWKIPMLTAPVEYEPNEPLPLDPYVLGVLLGDGHFALDAVTFCSWDSEIVEEVGRRLPEGCLIKKQGLHQFAINTGSHKNSRSSPNTVLNMVRALGLMGKRANDKFIPERYLKASVEARLWLLQGLMDTDGYVRSGRGSAGIRLASKELIEGVIELVQSLGGFARYCQLAPPKRKDGTPYLPVHMASLVMPAGFAPFRLSRKRNAWKPHKRQFKTRTLAKIERDQDEASVCIKVQAVNGLYVTRGYIITHNTCEVLQKVYGLPLTAPNMGNEFSTGPRDGLALFRRNLPPGNSKATVRYLDAFAEDLRKELRLFHEVEVPIEELETALCDFHSMVKGRYAPGHDIDYMQLQLERNKRPDLMEAVWAARTAALPREWLGELNGWPGRSQSRDQWYKKHGQVLRYPGQGRAKH